MKKTRAIKEHWSAVAGLGCIICQRPAEVAHCHGGSISDQLPRQFHPGVGQKQNHWLVLPICPEHHRVGPESLDGGSVRDWERRYGSQIDLLMAVSYRLQYSVFDRAGVPESVYQSIYRPHTAQPQPNVTDALGRAEESQ
jgi:hypothetical protein